MNATMDKQPNITLDGERRKLEITWQDGTINRYHYVWLHGRLRFERLT
jgi:hypothetical protein